MENMQILIKERCNLVDPEEAYSVDEEIVPFKGSLNIKYYIQNKRTKWEVKLFLMCEMIGFISVKESKNLQ